MDTHGSGMPIPAEWLKSNDELSSFYDTCR